MIKALIYDLDNTLYNEREYFLSTFSVISKHIRESHKKVESQSVYNVLVEILDKKGSLYPYLFNDALEELGLSYNRAYIKKLVSLFHNIVPNIQLYDDAKFTIQELRRRNYRLGLITNGNIKSQKIKVKQLGLSTYFEKIFYCDYDRYGFEKPNDMPYSIMLGHLNLEAEEAVYVGDNPYVDFYGAKKVGIQTVRLLRGEFCNAVVNKIYDAENRIKHHIEIFRILSESESHSLEELEGLKL